MASEFCPYCGASMETADPEWTTCTRKCKDKLRGFCKDVAKQWIALCESEREPGESLDLHEFVRMVHEGLARRVASPDLSIAQMGNARLVAVLPRLLHDSMVPDDLDGELYGRLVASGFVAPSDYVYRNLLARAKARPGVAVA